MTSGKIVPLTIQVTGKMPTFENFFKSTIIDMLVVKFACNFELFRLLLMYEKNGQT